MQFPGKGIEYGLMKRYIKELFKKLVIKAKSNKEILIPLAFSTTLTVTAFLDLNYFSHRLTTLVWVFIGIAFSMLIMWIMFKAGFTVMRTLFLVNAEIALLIFLAQAYCGVVSTKMPSDDALKLIMVIGVAYISYEFFKRLLAALTSRFENVPRKLYTWEKVCIIGIFGFFTLVFIWALYQVVNPIISNLCIYKR